MQIAVAGSIATDHLMTFRGRFADSLVVEQLDKISVSFLADRLEIRRGGVAGNICFGMAVLGARPVLVGAAGEDFADYRSWLSRHGVVTDHVHVSETQHTARFVCTTDDDMAQIATFYAGAMSEARMIELGPIHDQWGLDLVLIGADDPDAMLRHTQECRSRGIPFVADPSQQLAFADGPFIRRLVDGADILITNEYESHLTSTKTGWSQEEIDERVTTRVITLGKDGALIRTRGGQSVHVPVAGEVERVDPTGVGDAFRAGFLVGLAGGLGHERCAQIGSVLAAHVLETVGTQEYTVRRGRFLERVGEAYGDAAVEEIAPLVRCTRD
ncbi:carbohydrate kinase family protein [Phycicoccus endophyticus]|uniref:Carbohydrate kinase family protein n=1 Tax=Phycicoccus endophyticus TaxID=1690220 RepID=A0A7G9R504_9MICO|nr:carbohydrate kinase family protein [Phycicoccus endophyticus]NHI20932.1 carbohydrate kinase family protein [Phycicoccus endophyticus]QNN50679.1 carbohydrate kinase family protein [Phycicoccus endophyticus]GGL22414.1 kinase [Phycicoccus endophyticus]